MIELAEESGDAALEQELAGELAQVESSVNQFRVELLLSGERDANNAILADPSRALEAPNHKTGPRCSYACTRAGPSERGIRSKRWISNRAMKRESRASRWR